MSDATLNVDYVQSVTREVMGVEYALEFLRAPRRPDYPLDLREPHQFAASERFDEPERTRQ